RPVELVEIDALDSEPSERRLALSPDRRRLEGAHRLGRRVRLVPDHPTLREDVGALVRRELPEEPTEHLLPVTETVDLRGVDPVYPQLDRVAECGQRCGVVLGAPAVGVTTTTDRPGAETYTGDLGAGVAESALREGAGYGSHTRLARW